MLSYEEVLDLVKRGAGIVINADMEYSQLVKIVSNAGAEIRIVGVKNGQYSYEELKKLATKGSGRVIFDLT